MAPANPKKPKATQKAARRARIVEEMRRADHARERRTRIITIAVAVAILGGIVGGGWYLLDTNEQKEQEQAAPVQSEQTWSKLARNHVDYPMSPAAGGDHDAVFQNCDGNVYDKEIRQENAVHSLEHGAVWITYSDKATDADVASLKERVSKTPYTLMSPYKDQSAPIALTAWGHQLKVAKASDLRVAEFLDKYVQGAQTPEPGAPCTGGTSS
ncbi:MULTISPECIES: DUF3105 domain-containing protein [Streptomyces]|uniref:DUF3105 domain-containing protein n=1 Tax=Streptomyces TaxID=1883 RepID=UPI001488F86A|nr:MULTISPECIES: DUF3105 domain-containing protein [Streptomyces]